MNEYSETEADRLLELRLKDLEGSLTAAEAEELANLMASLEAEEATTLAPAMATLQSEQEALRERLHKLQTENDELAKLLGQQEQLVNEARGWLLDFARRHKAIQQKYTFLTGEKLAA